MKKEILDIYTSLCNYGVELGLESGKLNDTEANNIRSMISNYRNDLIPKNLNSHESKLNS